MTIAEIINGDCSIRPTIKNYADPICTALHITRKPTVYTALKGQRMGNGRYEQIREWALTNLNCEVVVEKKIKITKHGAKKI